MPKRKDRSADLKWFGQRQKRSKMIIESDSEDEGGSDDVVISDSAKEDLVRRCLEDGRKLKIFVERVREKGPGDDNGLELGDEIVISDVSKQGLVKRCVEDGRDVRVCLERLLLEESGSGDEVSELGEESGDEGSELEEESGDEGSELEEESGDEGSELGKEIVISDVSRQALVKQCILDGNKLGIGLSRCDEVEEVSQGRKSRSPAVSAGKTVSGSAKVVVLPEAEDAFQPDDTDTDIIPATPEDLPVPLPRKNPHVIEVIEDVVVDLEQPIVSDFFWHCCVVWNSMTLKKLNEHMVKWKNKKYSTLGIAELLSGGAASYCPEMNWENGKFILLKMVGDGYFTSGDNFHIIVTEVTTERHQTPEEERVYNLIIPNTRDHTTFLEELTRLPNFLTLIMVWEYTLTKHKRPCIVSKFQSIGAIHLNPPEPNKIPSILIFHGEKLTKQRSNDILNRFKSSELKHFNDPKFTRIFQHKTDLDGEKHLSLFVSRPSPSNNNELSSDSSTLMQITTVENNEQQEVMEVDLRDGPERQEQEVVQRDDTEDQEEVEQLNHAEDIEQQEVELPDDAEDKEQQEDAQSEDYATADDTSADLNGSARSPTTPPTVRKRKRRPVIELFGNEGWQTETDQSEVPTNASEEMRFGVDTILEELLSLPPSNGIVNEPVAPAAPSTKDNSVEASQDRVQKRARVDKSLISNTVDEVDGANLPMDPPLVANGINGFALQNGHEMEDEGHMLISQEIGGGETQSQSQRAVVNDENNHVDEIPLVSSQSSGSYQFTQLLNEI